jgi:hypothetical protein
MLLVATPPLLLLLQLYPGDELSWSCSYNTTGTERTVQGGYGANSEEQCNVQLHYWPRKEKLRGCQAVSKQQGYDSLCNFELDAELIIKNAAAREFPYRCEGCGAESAAAACSMDLQFHPF